MSARSFLTEQVEVERWWLWLLLVNLGIDAVARGIGWVA